MTDILDKRVAACLVALMAAMCLMIAGCASGGDSTSASAGGSESAASGASFSVVSEASSSAASEELSFGEKTATALIVAFSNETGSDITGLAAAPVGIQDTQVELMKAGESLPKGEEAKVYLEPVNDGRFTLSFACAGTQYQLHDVDFARLDAASILLQDDVAYLTVVLDGNPISTLQEEYDIAHPPAAPPAAEPEPTYYEEPAETYYDEPAADAPAQSEDACVDDVILN